MKEEDIVIADKFVLRAPLFLRKTQKRFKVLKIVFLSSTAEVFFLHKSGRN